MGEAEMRCTGQRCLVAIKDGEVLLCRLRAMSGRVASPARDWFPLCVRSVASNSVEGHHQGLGSCTFDGGPAPQRIERIEDLTIGDLLCEAARESGDRIALVDGVPTRSCETAGLTRSCCSNPSELLTRC